MYTYTRTRARASWGREMTDETEVLDLRLGDAAVTYELYSFYMHSLNFAIEECVSHFMEFHLKHRLLCVGNESLIEDNDLFPIILRNTKKGEPVWKFHEINLIRSAVKHLIQYHVITCIETRFVS
jgi:hypothetical protein